MELTPVTLEGRHVRLVPLTLEHVPALWQAADEAEIWRWTLSHPRSEEDMRRYVEAALVGKAAGASFPFATLEAGSGRVIGSTRFHNWEPPHPRVEIGYTWLAGPWRRTPANTEAKYLMLRHAFETLGLARVELRTDALNARSRAAILRLGATEEGTLRRHMLNDAGRIRDTVYFSILDDEWPRVKAGLEEKLARPLDFRRPMTIRATARLLPLLFAATAACTATATRTPAISPPVPATTATTQASTGTAFAAAIDSIFSDSVFASANWGVEIKSLETGRVLYQRNAGKMFVPASNMKLVTSTAALETLGPGWRFRTAVVAGGAVENGVLRGDLVVVGSGDPTIAADFHDGDPLVVFRAWADSLRAHGVTRITGRVVGDDDVFDDRALGRGWAWDDLDAYYSAEVGGLQYNLGVLGIEVAPGDAPGARGRVTLLPATAYAKFENRTHTVSSAPMVEVEGMRQEQGTGIVVVGDVPADTVIRTEVAVRNNTAYFVTVLRETLQAAGIRVDGAAVDQDDLDAADRPARRDTLFVQSSAPLAEILPGFLKPSQNQIGELLLKTLGRALRGQGTAAAGIAVVDSVQRAWGLPRGRLAQADGSGLSRYNLVAPELLIALLEHMRGSANYSAFYAALPVAGVDGTLAGRMKGTPLQGNVHAKTGTVSNVRSLSGYLTTAAGEPMVFSMIVNHHTVSSRDADRVAETALLRLYSLPRAR